MIRISPCNSYLRQEDSHFSWPFEAENVCLLRVLIVKDGPEHEMRNDHYDDDDGRD